MTEVLTAAQMKAIEAAAIASGVVTGLEMMERAGTGVVAAVLEEWPELALTSQRAVVLCGPGNNGGDGFVVARLLAARGWDVEVYLYGTPEGMPPDARVNYERWLEVGEVLAFAHFLQTDWSIRQEQPGTTHVVFDALFGIGLCRTFEEGQCYHHAVYVLTCEVLDARLVAIDVPSGMCSDSGRMLFDHFVEDFGRGRLEFQLTVTFHRMKQGHVQGIGPELCGKVRIAELGLPDTGIAHSVRAIQGVWVGGGAPSDIDKRSGHKFTHGHALIVSGDHGHAGAARMAARGALRIGAGLVTLASPRGAMAENAARLDAVMLKPMADAAGLAEVLADKRITALCLGPGMGVSVAAAALLTVALGAVRDKHAPYLLLDADALTLLAGDAELSAQLNDRCILTPHGGEFARLFPDIAAKLAAPATTGPAYSKVDATREAAVRAGCVVLYKGADTVIAAPDGRCSINAAVYKRSAPWLATAGSGDVLAGFITGLLARGFAPMQAAETAAWLHVECARSFGPGLIAEDLPEELPKVFRSLGL